MEKENNLSFLSEEITIFAIKVFRHEETKNSPAMVRAITELLKFESTSQVIIHQATE